MSCVIWGNPYRGFGLTGGGLCIACLFIKVIKVSMNILIGLVGIGVLYIISILLDKSIEQKHNKKTECVVGENIKIPKDGDDKIDPFGKASFALGLIAIPLWAFSIFPLLALVFGVISLSRTKHGDSGRWMAITGLVLGIVYSMIRISHL